nr:hypothetical protein [Bradyrhizobium stylosanthis]
MLAYREIILITGAVLRRYQQCVESSWDIDPDVVIKMAILGCERSLDLRVGQILKKDRHATANPPANRRIGQLAEKTSRDIGSLQTLLLGAGASSRNGKRQQQEQSAESERQDFGSRFEKEPALPPAERDAVN